MIQYRRIRYSILISITIFLINCAHIPRESVLLSEELTFMTNSARIAHLAMLNEYMSAWRHKADLFIEQKWIPTFLITFVDSSAVLTDFEEANTSEEKAKIMMEFTEACSKEIYKNRATLMEVLDEIELILRNKIEDHYADMLMINQALTAHLRSAAEVTSTRGELIRGLKVEPEKILPFDKINGSIEKILGLEGKLENHLNIVEEVKALTSGGK